jgi:hypothetical protein
MRSNFLKQQYESENNMMFDLVIKARYDICYPNDGTKFEDLFHYDIREKTIYSYFDFMEGEFFLPCLDDVIYYGTSFSMDLIDSIYNQLSAKSLDKLLGTDHDNVAYNHVGPGVLLYKWGSMKNMLFRQNAVPYTVYRKQAIGLDSNTEFEKIRDVSHSVF